MADVDLAREPPDGAFDHPPSKRRYQIVRKDGALWHRELLRTDGPQEVVLEEHPVKYVVGSGRHALTYLVEVDGFLVESPVTWYPSQSAWGMSPGYDGPNQFGFSRAVGEGCLYCHAGRSEVVGASLHRMSIPEEAIGCERCHGPGSVHVARHAGRPALPSLPPQVGEAVDYTIVNPAHLSRELSEAVCQQCHLKSVATVPNRGRKLSDFRPGLPLEDFRQDYVLETADPSMTVVGHVEQMHLSRCYRESGTLSCLTCHDPHGEPAAKDRTTYYDSVCLKCHKPAACTVDPHRRERESPANDCVQCHMPRSPTDIPHLAFTHHRIAVYDKPPAAPLPSLPPRVGEGGVGGMAHGAALLRPFLEFPQMSDIDRKRSLGLACLSASLREKDPEQTARYQKQALELLTGVRKEGLHDADVDAGLAQLCFDLKTGDPLSYAESALAQPDLAGQSRCDALLTTAQVQAERGNYPEALAALHELTQLRRHALDWLLLANCERALGDEHASEEALAAAVRINPRGWNVHRYLADHFRQQGDAERAAWHEQRAVP